MFKCLSSGVFALLPALFTVLGSVFALDYPDYGTMNSTSSNGVMNVVINNPHSQINIVDYHFQSDLARLVQNLKNDTTTKVVVFSSGNPDFFLAHFELLPTPG